MATIDNSSWVSHLFNRFVQNENHVNSFDVIESFIQLICSPILIYLGPKHLLWGVTSLDPALTSFGVFVAGWAKKLNNLLYSVLNVSYSILASFLLNCWVKTSIHNRAIDYICLCDIALWETDLNYLKMTLMWSHWLNCAI